MVKIEEYDDERVPSGSEHALVPYVPKINLSDGNLASGVVIAKEHVSPDRCNVKMETDFSTREGKRSYTSLTSDAGFYYEDKNNEDENRQDLPNMPIHGSVVELSEKDETGMYKNLLQEKAQKASLELPVYTTTQSGPGHSPVFSSVVELDGMSFRGAPAKKKKKAEKNAARADWVSIKQNLVSTHHQRSQQQTTERDSTF